MHQALTTTSGSTGSFYLAQERPFGGPLPASSEGQDRQQTHVHVHIHASRPEWRGVVAGFDHDRRASAGSAATSEHFAAVHE